MHFIDRTALALCVFALAGIVFSTVCDAADTPWLRHAVDDSSIGADGVRLADVNGDGLMDIATGWEEGGVVRAYLNPGYEKAKLPWPAVTVGEVRSPEDAVFVDLDADGAVDVVSCCEGKVKSVFVHWAPGDTTDFMNASRWKTEPFPALHGTNAWMFALPMQVDEKNGVDLIVGAKGKEARIGWLESPKNARDLDTWRWWPIYPAGWIMSLVGADMDGDGDTDVLVSDRRGDSRGCLWLENPGAGPKQKKNWPVHRIGSSDKEVMFLNLEDLDGDGIRDLLAAVAGPELVLHRRGADDAEFWERLVIPLPAGTGRGKGVCIADVDLDGQRDIVFTCERSEGKHGAMWLSYEGPLTDGRWTAHPISGVAEGVKFDRIEMLDLDGDGDRDMLTCEERDCLGVIWYENPTRNRTSER